MISIVRRYRYLVRDIDRHGNIRWYVRRKGARKIRLPFGPDAPGFDLAFGRAIEGRIADSRPSSLQKNSKPGSVSELISAYYSSAAYKHLDERTRNVRRRVLDRFREEHGDKRVEMLRERHVIQIRDSLADTPAAANSLLKYLRQVWKVGKPLELVKDDPICRVPYFPPSSPDGFRQWTIEEVRKFETQWPVGTKQRLALALLLYTGQRRSDVIRLGHQQMADGCLTFTQVKNAKKKPVTLTLPVIPELAHIIKRTPTSGGETFLQSARGGAFTGDGFGNAFRRWVQAAGLGGISPHGLRKAASARLAELGATGHEIKAITGHTTLKEVDRYTKAADQRAMAKSGMKKLAAGTKKMSHRKIANGKWDKSTPQVIDFNETEKKMVPRVGIEPTTLQFSIACSTN